MALPIAIDLTVPVAALSEAFGVAAGGPWMFNGDLYIAVTDHTYSTFTAIYVSTNGGNTWSPLDTGGQPTISGIVQFDGNQTLVCAFPSAGNGSEGGINLQNFDLATQTWGSVYGTASPPTGNEVDFVGFRPDGSVVVLYDHFVSATHQTGKFFAVFAANAWSAGVGVDINFVNPDPPELGSTERLISAVIDQSGNVHVFMDLFGTTGLPWFVFYQEVTAANGLGSFFTFPGSNNGDLISLGVPVVINGKIFLPAFVSDAGAVGFFLGSGSTWGSVIGPIDPGLATDATLVVDTSSTPGFAALVNGTLVVIYVAQGSNTAWIQARMRVLTQTNLANPATGWTGQTVADAETFPANLLPIGAPDSQRILGLGPFLPGVGNMFNMFEPQSASFDQVAFFLPFAVATSGPLKITLRGVKRVRCDPPQEIGEVEDLPHVQVAI